ncbi:MAG: protein kinase [Symploca sp. SIO2C1]|nr:protein kinase [Symploca sp. SIO2C1]
METILAGHYQILKHLGGGGFGQTFLARDNHLPGNPLCVVKQLQPRVRNQAMLEVAQRLFEREAQTLYQLGNHNQIPRLLAHFEQNEEFYLVQEFIEGQPLGQEILPGKQLSEAEVIALLQDILQVLSFVHQQRVIHRDIKPANLIRRSLDGKIVLIDFGAVKQVRTPTISSQGQTSLTVAVGSPGYMPSEQLAGKPHFSSDIYAVGMMCLQALTGLSPGTKEIATDDSGEFCCSACPSITPVSPDFGAILDKMVRYDYRQRYKNASQTLAALEQLNFPGRLISCNTPTIPMSSPPPGERKKGWGNEQTDAETRRHGDAENGNSTQTIARQRNSDTDTPLSRQEYRNRQILLNKVKNYWVKGVLETSLHGKALIELGLEERSNAVERPWGLMWESSETPQQPLPPGTRLLDKFEEMGAGRTLLILGEPGSGKTTTLLELTRDLIKQTESDLTQPIPVVFNLSSWSGQKQTITDWLVQELHTKYQVSQEIGQNLVNQQQLLLLLDGLDEVEAQQREACVNALNHFHQEYGQTEMVVCSRIRDYEALSLRLRFQAAIYLQSLTLSQIQQYLASAGSELRAISRALETDAILQELAQSPLMLNIMTLAYQGMSIDELPSNNLEQLRQHLFNAYVERMFNRRSTNSLYPKEQTKRWLIWLAKQMSEKSQTVFLIEHLQPSWLETNWQKWMYAIGIALTGGLIIGLGGGLSIELILGKGVILMGGLILGLGGGLIAGLILGLILNQIEPVEHLKWSWIKAKKNLVIGAYVGLIVGLIFGLSSGLIIGLSSGPAGAIQEGLIYGCSGLGTGVIFVLLRGLTGGGIETSTIPNQGIWQSVQNTMIFTLIGVVAMGVFAYCLDVPIMIGAFVGLLFGLFCPAGIACLQHLNLHLVLYFSGYIPWNYARFLNYATRLIFLQKVGGGYIFIHRLLLEHFAGQYSVCSIKGVRY